MDIKKEYTNNLSQNNRNVFSEQKTKSQIKKYYKDLKLLLNKRPVNAKGKAELFQFKKKIIDLIKDNFKEKYILFIGNGEEIDLQLFIEYLCQLLKTKMSKMVEGYNILEKMDKNQLLLLSKTKNTIISFLISFYDFYEDELVINNEEIVAEIINKKNILEDSFIMILLKILNLLNMPYITKDEFINLFKEEKKSKKNIFLSKDFGYLILKIIEFTFKIRNLNINKKKISQKNLPNLSNNNNDMRNNINKINDQFSIFLGIFFENIVPSLIEFFTNVILEYDSKNTINFLIQKDELSVLLTNFNSIKSVRNKIFNILCGAEKLFLTDQNIYIKNIFIKNNLFEKVLFFITKDINNNKYFSLKDFLFEIKKIIKYYITCNSQSEDIDKKLINIISLGASKIKPKNIKNINTPKFKNNDDILLSFFKEINSIGKEEPEQKYKVYNFLITIFQSSSILRIYIYKILLDNFAGDLNNYQDMLGHTNFLSIFVGNLCKCNEDIIDYFFGFLHSLDKFKYFPDLELTNIIYSLSCFEDVKSIQILMNNLELYNKDLVINNNNNLSKNNVNKNNLEDNINEKKDLLEDMNKSFLDIFSNIINDIINYYEEKNKITESKDKKEEIIKNKNNEQRNIFSSDMIFPLLEYISKIIQDNKIYQYFIEKNFIISLNSLFNTNGHKIVAYKFNEVLMKSSKNKDMNEDRVKVILSRIDFILNRKEEKSKKIMDEFEKITELTLIIKSLTAVIEFDILPNRSEETEKSINKKNIKEIIISGLCKCFDYFKINEKNIISDSVFNDKYHNLVKNYLNSIFSLFIKSNKNCINKKNINAPVLEKQYFERIIYNLISLYKLVNDNIKNENINYLMDIIIFLINKALNINSLTNKKKIYIHIILIYFQ